MNESLIGKCNISLNQKNIKLFFCPHPFVLQIKKEIQIDGTVKMIDPHPRSKENWDLFWKTIHSIFNPNENEKGKTFIDPKTNIKCIDATPILFIENKNFFEERKKSIEKSKNRKEKELKTKKAQEPLNRYYNQNNKRIKVTNLNSFIIIQKKERKNKSNKFKCLIYTFHI